MLLIVWPDPLTPSPQSSQMEAVPSLGRSIPLHQKLSAFLQNWSKWQQEQEDLTVGTIILIIDPQLPSQWQDIRSASCSSHQTPSTPTKYSRLIFNQFILVPQSWGRLFRRLALHCTVLEPVTLHMEFMWTCIEHTWTVNGRIRSTNQRWQPSVTSRWKEFYSPWQLWILFVHPSKLGCILTSSCVFLHSCFSLFCWFAPSCASMRVWVISHSVILLLFLIIFLGLFSNLVLYCVMGIG